MWIVKFTTKQTLKTQIYLDETETIRKFQFLDNFSPRSEDYQRLFSSSCPVTDLINHLTLLIHYSINRHITHDCLKLFLQKFSKTTAIGRVAEVWVLVYASLATKTRWWTQGCKYCFISLMFSHNNWIVGCKDEPIGHKEESQCVSGNILTRMCEYHLNFKYLYML
jgi:hypothetical protein